MGLTAHRNGKPVKGWRATAAAFSESLPVYVTREAADGLIASYSISLWMSLLVLLLVWLNVVVWGVVGLIAAFGVLF